MEQKQFAFPVSYRPTSQEQLVRIVGKLGEMGYYDACGNESFVPDFVIVTNFSSQPNHFGYLSEGAQHNGPIVSSEASFLAIAGQVKEGEKEPVVGCWYKSKKSGHIYQIIGYPNGGLYVYPIKRIDSSVDCSSKDFIMKDCHLATPSDLIAAFGEEVADKVDQAFNGITPEKVEAFNGSCGTRIPDGPITGSSMSMNDDDQYVTRDLMNWSKPKESRTPDFFTCIKAYPGVEEGTKAYANISLDNSPVVLYGYDVAGDNVRKHFPNTHFTSNPDYWQPGFDTEEKEFEIQTSGLRGMVTVNKDGIWADDTGNLLKYIEMMVEDANAALAYYNSLQSH